MTTVPRPDGEWRGMVSVGGTATGGNTQTVNVGANADAVRQTDYDKLGFYFQDVFARSTVNGNTQTPAKQVKGGGRYDRDLTERLYAYGGLDAEKNVPANVRLRILPQTGLGYHIVKSDPLTFNVFAGYAYNHQINYAPPNTIESEAMLGEETIHKLSPTTSFHQKLVLFPSITESGEYRGQFDAGLVTAIVRSLNLTLTLSDRYDHKPSDNVRRNDYLVFTGIQYVWGPR
jgi:putative salt-induced outer membrane protein